MDIIKSSLDEDFIISEEDVEQFLQNLENPDPKRVKIRQKTLEQAKKIYDKYTSGR